MRADASARRTAAPRPPRAAFVVAAIALVAGLWGGLARLGLEVPAPEPFTAHHGLLMTLGFLGTVISLERAVALATPPAYFAPVLAAAAALTVLTGQAIAPLALLAAGVAFALVSLYMVRRRTELGTATMAAGAGAWVAAAALLLARRPVADVVPLLAAYLVLTVVGERLELAALTRPPAWARAAFAACCVALLAGALLHPAVDAAIRVAGLGLVGLALWLARWDVARRTVLRAGATRYIAASLLTGYAWLAIGGVTWIVAGGATSTFAYDATIHTVFVGFVLSMIFAHELIVVPAVLGIAIPFTRAFYVPLVLLSGSLAMRIVGDATSTAALWQWAAVVNVVAVLLFAAVTVLAGRGVIPRA